jgi:hypothetical protein
MVLNHAGAYSQQRLATDAVGTFTLRIKNVMGGSRYRVEYAASGVVAEPSANAEGVVSGTVLTDVDLTLNLYVGGSASNDLRVKVRKGTAATKFLPFETQVVAQSGTVIAYIAQVADPIA